MPRESTLIAAIARHVKSRGGWCVKLHGGPYQAAGLPDLVIVYRGVTIWIEAKTAAGSLTAIQQRQHDLLRAAGARVHVVQTVAEVAALLDEVDTK